MKTYAAAHMKAVNTGGLFSVLIPAYNPDISLVALVQSLVDQVYQVVVVDDGSREDANEVFGQLTGLPNTVVLRHETNRGKGAALKTGLAYIAQEAAEGVLGVVTADADGQHSADDIIKVGAALVEQPDALVLGVRDFKGVIPARSLLGNVLTRWIFRLCTGIPVLDTQTGLRGIPKAAIKDCLQVDHNRYEYEMAQLMQASQCRQPIVQVPISCLYFDDNKNSHFNPLRDSLRIYYVFFRFISSSLISATVDYIVFLMVYALSGSLFVSQYSARLISGSVNYTINRRIVFKSKAGIRASAAKYILLAVSLAFCGYLLITALVAMGIPVFLAKPLAEGSLFFLNFFIQKKLILR